MAQQEVIYTTGLIPIDLSKAESWTGSGAVSYELGENTFRLLGYAPVKSEKKQIRFIHEIIAGPKANIGKRFSRLFTLDKEEGLNFLRGYCDVIGGEQGLQRGQPNMQVLAGTVFKGVITSHEYENKGKQSTAYDIDLNTVQIVSRPNGGGAGGAPAGGFAPVQ